MQISAHQGQQMALLARTISAGAPSGSAPSPAIRRSASPSAGAGASSGAAMSARMDEHRQSATGRKRAGQPHRAHHRPGAEDPRLVAGAGLAGQLDMAFIGANKNDYDAYYERCLKLVRKATSLIDNVLWGGSVPTSPRRTKTRKRPLNAKLRATSVSSPCSLAGDGATCALKRWAQL